MAADWGVAAVAAPRTAVAAAAMEAVAEGWAVAAAVMAVGVEIVEHWSLVMPHS